MSVEFDGTNYFQGGHDCALDGCGSMSWSFWMYPNVVSDCRAIICNRYFYNGNNSWGILFDGGYFYNFITSNGVTQKSNRVLANNWNTTSWQHTVVTFDKTAAQNIHIFRNGVELTLETATDIDANLFASSFNLQIGCVNHDHGCKFDGKLDEIAIWKNQVLTLDEIKLLYQSRMKRMPLRIHPETLGAYFPMDDRNIGQAFVGADCLKDISNVGTVEDCDATNNPTGTEGILSYPSKIIMI